MLKNRACTSLITNLCRDVVLSLDNLENCMKFIQTIVYNGKDKETYVETRIRLYRQQKKKTSRNLPPDQNSCYQAILRAHHQAYQYLRVADKIMEPLPLKEYGWVINDISSRQKNKPKAQTNGNDADDESMVEPPAKRKMLKHSSEKSFKEICLEFERDYDADSDRTNSTSDNDDDVDDNDNDGDDDWEHFSDFGTDSDIDSDSDW